MRIIIILAIAIVASVFGASAQPRPTPIKQTDIPQLPGEKWWGAMTALGRQAPFTEIKRVPLSSQSMNNQNAPMLVSNMGRYIVTQEPFDFAMTPQTISIFATSDTIGVQRAGKTLTTAYHAAFRKIGATNALMPPAIFFEKPQWNTWIELNYNQNQADILAYAHAIVDNGLPTGIMMIDDSWQRYFGNYDFKTEKFPDPLAMIEELHRLGFKVMLWVSPFVSPDSPEFRELEAQGLLVKNHADQQAAVVRWWNGYSAQYDLTNPKTADYLYAKLRENQRKYKMDGFKFDGGDLNFYQPSLQQYADPSATSAAHTQLWAEFALRFPYNELRACWALQGQPLVQRLGDKDYSWGALQVLVPEMLNAAMMGYAYTCPDMIGGGQIGSFKDVQHQTFDQSLIVRSAQLHALMPMMQFSVAPWRILDAEHLELVKQAVRLHEKIAPYIVELAEESSRTGAPIIRPMEYSFPQKGFSECNDQYMIGTRYLVAPITTADGQRMVRLPRGRWTDDLGKVHTGPVVLQIEAPLSRIPYFESRR